MAWARPSVVPAELFITELGVHIPTREEFAAVGDLLALRRSEDGTYYASNYLRGPLLYALVAARRPSGVLEFGTGRGYGAVAMARAMADGRIDGLVYTIDVVPPDRDVDWPYRDMLGPRVERWSRRAFWERHVPREWRERIVCLTGRSTEVIGDWRRRQLPRIDLAFIDGGHDYATARHDLIASAFVGSDRLGVLLDDHADRPGFGVVRAVADLTLGHLPVTLISTDWGPSTVGPDRGMAWIDLANYPQERRRISSLPRQIGVLERLRSAVHL